MLHINPSRGSSSLVMLILSLLTISIHAQVIPHSSSVENGIDALFSDYDTADSPGGAIAVVKDGELIYSKGYGLANLEYGVSNTSQTIFHAASLSKQFTAFAALLCEEQGLLSMEDDLRKYIPELPDFGQRITLLHLASHSSGLKDQWNLLMMSGLRLDDVITYDHVFKIISRQQELNFNPGDENMYSNTGFTLLAEVVSRVSGMSFADFTKKYMFEPLGMSNTFFYDDHEKIVKNRAYSYKKADGDYKKSILSYANVGATSLLTNVDDFAKWAANFHHPIVGSLSTIEKLNTVPDLNNKKGKGFALGQVRGEYNGVKVFVHSGSDAGFKAYFGRVPAHNLSVVVLANISTINPIEQVFGTINLYLSEYMSSQEDSQREIFQHDPSSFVSLSTDKLSEYVGTYWEPIEGYERKLYINNDTLIYYRSEYSQTPLLPVSDREFKMIGDTEDVSVLFNNNEHGQKRAQVVINDRPPLDFLLMTPVDIEKLTGLFHSEELSTSYAAKIKDGSLVLEHSRLDDIVLKPINQTLFTSDNRNFKKVEFVYNNGALGGMHVSNERVRNQRFIKVDK